MLLYIHVPFCDSKCFYCAFNSYVDKYHLKDLYVEALIKDLEFNLKKYVNKDKNIETIFIGGGTPSTLNMYHYQKIFDTLKPYLSYTKEITIEANPNSASNEWLQNIFDLGVKRVSFGVQSFRDDKLNFLGRNHTQNRAIKAIQEAKDIGFEHINLDLIYGCDIDTKENMLQDIQIANSLPVDHISAYSLTIEEDTKFYNTPSVKIDDYELSLYIFEELKRAGFKQYEISNFAKGKGAVSKHNLGYWEYKEYIGCGSGAVGRVANNRYYKDRSVENYIKDPLAYCEIEKLSDNDILTEKVLLGLRSMVGVDTSLIDSSKVDILLREDKVYIKENRVYLKDYLIADEVALYLF